MLKVVRRFTFEAAHYLSDYNGVCKNLHGHRFELEVGVGGEKGIKGMIIDFKELDRIVKGCIIEKLDHACLNESILTIDKPTCENLISYIRSQLTVPIHNACLGKLVSLKLYETENSYCEWNVSC